MAALVSTVLVIQFFANVIKKTLNFVTFLLFRKIWFVVFSFFILNLKIEKKNTPFAKFGYGSSNGFTACVYVIRASLLLDLVLGKFVFSSYNQLKILCQNISFQNLNLKIKILGLKLFYRISSMCLLQRMAQRKSSMDGSSKVLLFSLDRSSDPLRNIINVVHWFWCRNIQDR